MDKPDLVKLHKEVVEKIEFCLARSTKEQMLKAHRDENRLPKILNELEFDQLAQALYIGYEVEQTPEEQIRSYFLKHWENQKTFSLDIETSKVICVTITNVLDTLNIKIKGVNDHE